MQVKRDEKGLRKEERKKGVDFFFFCREEKEKKGGVAEVRRPKRERDVRYGECLSTDNPYYTYPKDLGQRRDLFVYFYLAFLHSLLSARPSPYII